MLSDAPPDRIDDDAYLGQFIPLHYHGQMLADNRRMSAFREAIEKLVPVGAHVVELGGGTGVLSFFASKRARKVTCVERLPHVAAAARRLLAANGAADRVTVVEADARTFVPDEPADVLICEMLHAALLREKQISVVRDFKARHQTRFGRSIPRIIPEASILAVQPIFQSYDFHGYYAPVPLFSEPGVEGSGTIEMGEPGVYSIVEYVGETPIEFAVDRCIEATTAGTINALRFITKNAVGILADKGRSVDWHMQYMALPLGQAIGVNQGERVRVRFQYRAGGTVQSLAASIQAALWKDDVAPA